MIEFFNRKSIKDIKEEKDNRKLAPDEVVKMIKDVDTNLDQVTESMEATNMETVGAMAELFETSQEDKIEIMGAIAGLFEASQNDKIELMGAIAELFETATGKEEVIESDDESGTNSGDKDDVEYLEAADNLDDEEKTEIEEEGEVQ